MIWSHLQQTLRVDQNVLLVLSIVLSTGKQFSAGSDSDLGLSLDTADTCIVHKQTNGDCATTKTDLTEGTKTTETPRRVSKREGTTSSTWVDRQTCLHFLILCVSSQHSPPNTVTRLSQNSIGHGVVGVNMVVMG